MKNIIRFLIAPWYLLGGVLHVYLALVQPEIYTHFGNTAWIPAYGFIWRVVVMPNILYFALALAAFELTVGALLIGRGEYVKYALAASILFNLFLVQLGLSIPAIDGFSDFLMNRLPNVIFIAVQVPLLFCAFECSLAESVTSFFRKPLHA
jgi:hypothetical protein